MSNSYVFTEYELKRFIVGSVAFVARLLSLLSAISSTVSPDNVKLESRLSLELDVSIYIACEVDLYKIQGYYECTFVYK